MEIGLQQQIRLGTITNIYNQFGIVRAQIIVLDSDSPEDVILLNPYGQNSCPPIGSFVEIFINFNNPENKYAIPFNKIDAPVLNIGETVLYNHFGTQIYLNENNEIEITATKTSASGDFNTNGVYKVDDTQVLAAQQSAIPNPTGGSTIDTQARASIISILTALRIHGIIAT